mmetsp:Transcript_18783/g.60323  ORF Transcript_18783/g.60323 Transcript_18783/m.60323 type:complete len:519 (+) Transcript_18783:229-1785(+)
MVSLRSTGRASSRGRSPSPPASPRGGRRRATSRARAAPPDDSQPDGADSVSARKAAQAAAKELADAEHAREQRTRGAAKKGQKEPRYYAQFVEPDSTLEALYKPHTLLALALTMAFVCYNAFLREFTTTQSRQRASLNVAGAMFLSFCAVQLRDNLLVRPHPVVWRVVQGLSVIYLCFLVYLLMQPVHEARLLMTIWDEEQGIMPRENYKLYATDCRVYTPDDPESSFREVRDAMDLFIFAHFFGWICKALLWRDWTICWMLSIMWEVCEISFQHLLPNFKECWWDHWVLDVGITNFAGMYIGMMLVRYFEAKPFNWTGVSNIRDTRAQLQRLLVQFTPFSFTSYTWRVLTSYKRLCQVLVGCGMFLTGELNVFFLKYVLWVSPGSKLNVMRLLLMFFVMFPAMREFYEYMSPQARRMGPNYWLASGIIVVELLVIYKASRDDPLLYNPYATLGIDPPVPVPSESEVIWAWGSVVVLFNLWAFTHFVWPGIRGGRLLFGSLIPLLYIVLRDAWSTFRF